MNNINNFAKKFSLVLLIAFATGAAAQSSLPEKIAAALRRERDLGTVAADWTVQSPIQDCDTPTLLSIKNIGKGSELYFRCEGQHLPFVAISHHRIASMRLRPTSMSSAVPVVITRGAKVRLAINRASIRMTLPAIALESAAEGATIRFRISGTHTVLRARVETPTYAVAED